MSLRHTGRTTRMLEEAILHALKGESVLVVAWSEMHAEMMLKHVANASPCKRMAIDELGFPFGGSIRFTSLASRDHVTRGERRDEKRILLEDHFATEMRFADRIIGGWYRSRGAAAPGSSADRTSPD